MSWVFALARPVLARMPLGLASLFAWGLAYLWWWVVPVRKAVAVENLRHALPEAPPRATLTRTLHDLCLGYVELLQLHRVEIDTTALSGLTGEVLLCGHSGSWDPTVLGCAQRVPLTVFLKPPAQPYLARVLTELRDAHGLHRLERGAKMADAYAALDAGRNVIFIQDQRYNAGPWLPFFGRPARTSLGAAVAASKRGREVVGVWFVREGVGRHRVLAERIPTQGTAEERTAQLNAWYEAKIRDCPHGWLWLHKRWA